MPDERLLALLARARRDLDAMEVALAAMDAQDTAWAVADTLQFLQEYDDQLVVFTHVPEVEAFRAELHARAVRVQRHVGGLM